MQDAFETLILNPASFILNHPDERCSRTGKQLWLDDTIRIAIDNRTNIRYNKYFHIVASPLSLSQMVHVTVPRLSPQFHDCIFLGGQTLGGQTPADL